MEGKCLPRPPNSLAAKEGLLILALTLLSSTSPEKGPPPSTHRPTVSGSSFLRLLSLLSPSCPWAPRNPQGPCVHSRELGPVGVLATGVIGNDVQASATLTPPQLPGPGPEQQSLCQQRGPDFELQRETESVLCHQTRLGWGWGVGREFQPCSHVNKQQEGNNKVEKEPRGKTSKLWKLHCDYSRLC